MMRTYEILRLYAAYIFSRNELNLMRIVMNLFEIIIRTTEFFQSVAINCHTVRQCLVRVTLVDERIMWRVRVGYISGASRAGG